MAHRRERLGWEGRYRRTASPNSQGGGGVSLPPPVVIPEDLGIPLATRPDMTRVERVEEIKKVEMEGRQSEISGTTILYRLIVIPKLLRNKSPSCRLCQLWGQWGSCRPAVADVYVIKKSLSTVHLTRDTWPYFLLWREVPGPVPGLITITAITLTAAHKVFIRQGSCRPVVLI